MSNGSMPTYSYVPVQRPGIEPELRTCSSRRARLFAGGTYFRSRELGLQQNLISIEVVELEPTSGPGTGEAYCIVMNENLKFDENVVGPVTTKILAFTGTYEDLYIIDDLANTSRARKYSISLRIAFERQTSSPVLPVPIELGRFIDGKLFVHSGKLSVKTEITAAFFDPGQTVSITPRTRIYRLDGVIPPPPLDPMEPTPPPGWDIANLRAQINANDPWVEMLERSGPIDDGMGGTIPNPNPNDVQDEGIDAPTLTPFARTRLSGGDGLPASPNNERTGPTRSIVHVNYGERQNGELAETNTLFEWVGDSAIVGSWQSL